MIVSREGEYSVREQCEHGFGIRLVRLSAQATLYDWRLFVSEGAASRAIKHASLSFFHPTAQRGVTSCMAW